MHIKLCFTVSLALALAGCIKIANDDEPKGTTKGQAAEALTKAMSFNGGERVAGLMPDGDSTAVMLLSEDAGSVGPGSASLMLMDFSPAEATVSAALVQFADAESHFLIDGSAFVASSDAGAADGGTAGSGGGHIELEFEIADDVCDELCATVYELDVIEALDLGKSGVTKHKTVKLKLDCREQGKKSLCSKENLEAATSGDEKLKDAGAQSDAGGDAGCTGDACTPPTAIMTFDCGDGFTEVSGAQLCDGIADCPGENPIDESGSACTHCADAVDTIYSIVMRCDGKDDCTDRSDELDCERTCTDGSSFKLVSLCDGTDDCRDSSDELGCDGGQRQFACKDDSYVPVEFVCNGVTECLTAEDEADCTRAPAADGAAGGDVPAGMSAAPAPAPADAGAQP
jgi:Low-density lipoprotein receptor domain class A